MTMTPNGAAPISEYLTRIEQDGAPLPTADALRVLQRAHLMHVPFDTIDTYLTRHEDLDPRTVTERIISQRRGGTRSQLNVGFAVLLHGLGYLVDLVLAGAESSRTQPAAPYLALIVKTDQRRFLVDVSGELSDEPLAIGPTATQYDTAGSFAISTATGPQLEVSAPGNRRYTIVVPTLGPDNVANANRHECPRALETAPTLSMRRERGRTTLTNGRLIETVGTARTEITLDAYSICQVVKDRFGVAITPSSLSALTEVKQ